MKKTIITIVSLLLAGCATFNIENRLDEFPNIPAYGLQSGASTTISPKYKDEILKAIIFPDDSADAVKRIWRYISLNYHSAPITDGANVRTVDELIRTKTLRHCGEYGVLWVSLLRLYGIPCRLISGLNLQEGKDLATTSFSGHEFVEAYIDNRYIIIDSTRGLFFEGKIDNRIIPIKINGFAPKGFIVMTYYYDPFDVIKKNEDWAVLIKETKYFYIENCVEPTEFWNGKSLEEL